MQWSSIVKPFSRVLAVVGVSTMLSVVLNPAHADTVEINNAFDQCMNNSGGVTSSMLECYDSAIKSWEQELNNSYKTLQDYCTEVGQTEGKESQKQCIVSALMAQQSWKQYRDDMVNVADYMSPFRGGSASRLDVANANLELVSTQAKMLMLSISE